jgi:hypothetical protein
VWVIRLLGSVIASLPCLLAPFALAQSAPQNGVPLITQVSPPSLSPVMGDPRFGNFTLTIIGANFPQNASVQLTWNGNYIAQPTSTVVNPSGTQIVAQFTNVNLFLPSIGLVTVTNPNGPLIIISNPFYLPLSPTPPSFALGPGVNSFLSGYPSGMTFGDFSVTGNLDLAVVSQQPGMLSILNGYSNGYFIPGPSYPARNSPSGIIAADFTGSGQLDLAITNSSDNTLTIFMANGPGSFRLGSTISLPDLYPTGLVAADFNGDGKIDLAVVNSCGTGNGGCFPQAGPIQAQGTVSILLGNGDGTFTLTPASLTTRLFARTGPRAIAAADFDRDGFIDLVVANESDHELTVFMGNGDGTFIPAFNSPITGTSPSGLVLGDFNGDGNIDIAVTNSNDNTVSILLNQNCPSIPGRNCTFAPGPAPPIAVGNHPTAIAAGDMNEDGFLDLVVANSMSNTVSVLLGDGTGNFAPVVSQFSPPFSTGQYPMAVVLGDFNHDGRLDIATANAYGSYSVFTQATVAPVVLSSSSSSSVYGQTVSFTAAVSAPPAHPLATGSVTFFDGSTQIGVAPLNSGQAFLQFAGLTVGAPHKITAVYPGDSNYALTTSNAVSQTVTQAQTTTTLTSNLNTAPYGQAVTLSATILPQISGTATGMVNFFDQSSSTTIGSTSVVNNVAQLTLSNLPPGAHVITAIYQGDSNFTGSNSPTYTENITQATTTIAVSVSPNQPQFAQNITFTATVQSAAANTATGVVAFYEGSTLLGTGNVANDLATFSTATLVLGPHTISAQYSGDNNFLNSSSTVSVTVTKSATTTTVSSSLATSTYGQNVTFSAAVTPAFGSLPSGQIAFYDGTNLLGTANATSGAAQITVQSLTGGTHSVTAQWVASYSYAASTSNAITQTVTPAPTTTSVSTAVNPSSYGQQISVSVTVDSTYHYSSNGAAVTLFDNGTSIGFEYIQGSTAVFPVSTLTAGAHSLTATYAGDSNLSGSTSAAYTQNVAQATTTTSLSSTSYSTLYGKSVTLTASIASAAGLPETGTVSFFDGATLLGTAPVSTATAQFTTFTLSPGTHPLSAQYSGDANFVGSTSSPNQTLTVSKDPTLTSVSVDVNPSTYGQSVTLTAAVQLLFGSGATGTVTFLDGTATLGIAPFVNGGAQLALSTLGGGSHSLTAQYSGDASFAGSTSSAVIENVNPAPTSATVTSGTNPATYGQAITLTATLQPPAGTTAIGSVTFSDGPYGIASVPLTNNTAQLTWSTFAAGSHSLTVVFNGNANLIGTASPAITETINQASTTVTITSNLNPAPFGQCVQFTGAVQPASGTTVPGTVTFFDGTTFLGSAYITNNTATFSSCGLQGGAHTITAKYNGDPNYFASTSAALTETVNPVASTVTLASAQNPIAFGSSALLTATVQPSISGDTATGTVTFFDGATSLGTVTLPTNEVAQLSLSNLSAGSHAITAKYNGDANFSGGTSSVLTQTVNLAATTTTIASSLNPAVYGQVVTFTAAVQSPSGTSATGTVTFLDGTTTLATVNLSGSSAQLAVALSPGSHSVTASYSGNANLAGSISPALAETVNQAATATAISANLNPSSYGQSVTFTASVQTGTGGFATGTVTFFDGSAQIGSASLSANSAQTTTTALAAGSHSISAQYNGDLNFVGSTSGALTQTVNPVVTVTPTRDVQVSADQSSAKSNVKTPAFSSHAANELLLAFISSDASSSGTNVKVNNLSGGGLTWTLVLRTNTQRGTAEIWRAFATSTLNNATVNATLSQSVSSSLTVMSFTGTDSSGTNGSGAIGAIQSANAGSGAPTAQLVTTRNGSLVIGVGDDYDNAISRTLGSGQILVHQFLSPVGDTYWVQMRNAPTLLSGTTVVINDTAPTGDRYNLAICEILPPQ